MSELERFFSGHPRNVTGEQLALWADEVLTAVANDDDLSPLCFESREPEATYPDALAFTLPETSMSADDDVWGSVLGAFFPLAGVIEAIGYYYDSPVFCSQVPSDWGYRSGAAGVVWERDEVPGEDAWERLATVAHTAIHRGDSAVKFDEWMVEHDEASIAIDVASIVALVSDRDLEDWPEAEDESWATALRVLLASGWCLHFAADNARRAGLDY